MDEGKATVLVMLDLSAAYDTVDHKLFLERLQNHFGFQGTAYSWVKSYLEGRSFSVSVNGKLSKSTTVECGVPQGSVLGGKFHNMYTVPLGKIAEDNSVERKGYADDNQIYISFSVTTEDMDTAIQKLQSCLPKPRLVLITLHVWCFVHYEICAASGWLPLKYIKRKKIPTETP